LFQHKKSVFLQLLTHAQSPELNQNYIKTITKVLYDLVSSLGDLPAIMAILMGVVEQPLGISSDNSQLNFQVLGASSVTLTIFWKQVRKGGAQ